MANIRQMDVLQGYEQIAAALGITVRQAKHRAAIGAIPIGRQGRRVFARRSTLAAAMTSQEAAVSTVSCPHCGKA